MLKKRFAALVSVMVLLASVMGCTSNKQNSDGKIQISVGSWPTENLATDLELYNSYKEAFEEKYPNIEIIPDTYKYDVSTFLAKASAKQLPTTYDTYFTDVKKIVNAGYAADISEYMKEYGYTDALADNFLDIVSIDDKQYAIPTGAYYMGLIINLNLFQEAGLLNEDGTAQIPQTYEEMAKTASVIKEKTGKAGFGLPTINNQGGWHFMNIAWSFGTEFMKQENGKWIATFDSQACRDALQYVKDLKWKYNALPDNFLVDAEEITKLIATDQAAMMFAVPSSISTSAIQNYEMSRDTLSIGCMPAGPGERVSLVGGGVAMISPEATPEQIDACFKWYDFVGKGPKVTDEQLQSIEKSAKTNAENGLLVGVPGAELWKDNSILEKKEEVSAKYRNINMDFYKEYKASEGLTLNPEEPQCCQELYKLMDSCMQKVLTDENADVAAIVKQAAEDFQKNYLDKEA